MVSTSWEAVKSTQATYHLVLTASTLMNFRHALTDIGNDGVGIQSKLGLEKEKSVANEQKKTERTLKTWRSLFRSDFHAAITFLSSIELTNREILPRPLRFNTFP